MLGRGGRCADADDAHGVVVGLHENVVDLCRPVEAPDIGDGADQKEDARDDDDGHDGDEAVANCLEVLVARDGVEERLAFLDERYELFHGPSVCMGLLLQPLNALVKMAAKASLCCLRVCFARMLLAMSTCSFLQ